MIKKHHPVISLLCFTEQTSSQTLRKQFSTVPQGIHCPFAPQTSFESKVIQQAMTYCMFSHLLKINIKTHSVSQIVPNESELSLWAYSPTQVCIQHLQQLTLAHMAQTDCCFNSSWQIINLEALTKICRAYTRCTLLPTIWAGCARIIQLHC